MQMKLMYKVSSHGLRSLTLLVRFFEDSGYLSLIIRENSFPDVPRLQTVRHAPDKFLMSLLRVRHLTFLRGHRQSRHMGGRCISMKSQ